MIKTTTTIYIFICFLPFSLFSQVSKKILQQENLTCLNNNFEKVYVQLDKKVYAAGSEIFHKAVVVNGITQKPEAKSKILYFEISDAKSQVFKWKSQLDNGFCSGNVKLPDSISTGYYVLKAYTNWMKNLPDIYIFKQCIFIINIQSTEDYSNKYNIIKTAPGVCEFLPEGGSFIAGIQNNIGFYGFPEEIQGNITNEQDNLLVQIHSNKEGRGNFSIQPDINRLYFANYVDSDGKNTSVRLPIALNKGYSLKTNITENHILVDIYSFNNESQLKIIISQKGKMIYENPVNVKTGWNNFSVEKSGLKPGIHLITLINNYTDILNERLIYISPGNVAPSIHVPISQSEFKTRDKVKLVIQPRNFLIGDSAFLAISVSEKAALDLFSENKPCSDVLNFQSELPFEGAYCDHIYNETFMNNLLLSVPSNQYLWNTDQDNFVNSPFLTEDKGYIFEGKIKNKITNKPYSNKQLILSVAGDNIIFKYFTTREDGSFYFLLDNQFNNKELILQVLDQNIQHNDIQWELKNDWNTNVLSDSVMTEFDKKEMNYLEYCKKIRLTELIFKQSQDDSVAEDRKINQINDFYIKSNYVVIPAEFVELPDFMELSQNLLPAVKYKYIKRKDEYQLKIYDPENHISYDENATVFFNGVIMTDLSLLHHLGTKDIEKIEVTRSKIFYGDLIFYGIISIYTNDRLMPSDYIKNNTLIVKNDILVQKKDPIDYFKRNSTNIMQSDLPDVRQTLYWNPEVIVSDKQDFVIEFETSDLKSVYEINIEGITKNGIPISKKIDFTVK